MRAFRLITVNTLVATVTNFFVWFALTFWLYLETQSVLATSLVGGSFMAVSSLSGFWFGSIVDHHRKKSAMLFSSALTLFFFSLALALYMLSPPEAFRSLTNPALWLIVIAILGGVIAGNIRNLALPTLVTILVSEDQHDRANGLTGMVMGLSSSGAGIASGLALGFSSMFWVLAAGVALTAISIVHLAMLHISEERIVHTAEKPKTVDIRGTIRVIRTVPGLFALIFFTTFNNFLGGAFIALMDPYGLSLVPVEIWGTIWGVLSVGFILGGMYIAKYGLGENPLRTIFLVNSITWTVCIFFTIQPSIVLLCVGILIWVFFVPFIEASEHTVIQKLVPLERQGRVFGFAQSVETAASPLTAFLVGPLAQFIFIPFMTTGAGVELIGGWFGVGPGRGIALVFIVCGMLGLLTTQLAMRTHAYATLSAGYRK